MTLRQGQHLGPYEIVAPLGSGGMGEVYRARDPRLQRDVAVKVLHATGTDPDRLQRFEVEARAAAAINHPNIVAVYDVGHQNGQPYVVSELLDGETLREQLTHGALPVRKAIDYGVQIARGLAAAHDKHVIHRDLKPENVFITRDGRAKILDFGLAKLAHEHGAAFAGRPDVSGLQTTPPATTPGVVLGTVGYMAPEQVRGGTIDHRTDIFALGAVLFEMLTGNRAFTGPSPVETMSAILKEELPEVIGAHGTALPALDRIVHRCAEKNPDERFQSARDLAFALEAISGSHGSHASSPALPVIATTRRTTRRIAIAALIVAAIAGAAVAGRMTAPAPARTDLVIESKTFEPQAIFNARFMPDGETVIFSAAPNGTSPELFVSRPGAAAPQPMGHRSTHLLSISRSGELAVLTDVDFIAHRIFRGTLARMPVDGAPRAWMENVREADWSPDGSTLAIVRDAGLHDRLEYPIGKVLHESVGYLSDPRVSPDGERVAFFDHPFRYDDRGWLKVVDRAGTVTTLTKEYWGAEGIAWAPDGKSVIFAAGESGWDSFYPRAVTLDGTPVPDMALPGIGLFLMDVASTGERLVTRNDDVRSLRARLPGETAEREYPWLGAIAASGAMLSRDGTLLLFSDESQSAGSNYAVSVRRTDGGSVVRLGPGSAAALSPDGRLALADQLAPRQAIVYPVGAGETVRLPTGPLESVTSRLWFPDGRRVVVCGNEPRRPLRCYQQDLVGGLPQPIAPEQFTVDALSRDGTVLALTGADRRKYTLRIGEATPQPIPGTTPRDAIIDWSEDGRSLFVQERPSVAVRFERVDVTSGRRSVVVDTAMPDRTGLLRVYIGSVSHDGDSYTYTYWKRMGSLYLVKDASPES